MSAPATQVQIGPVVHGKCRGFQFSLRLKRVTQTASNSVLPIFLPLNLHRRLRHRSPPVQMKPGIFRNDLQPRQRPTFSLCHGAVAPAAEVQHLFTDGVTHTRHQAARSNWFGLVYFVNRKSLKEEWHSYFFLNKTPQMTNVIKVV